MKRETGLAFFLCLLSAMIPLAFAQLASAQNGQSYPGPVAPSDILGSQLVVWSEVQKPQPISQPLPSPNRADPQPDHQPAQTANQSNRSKGPAPAVPESFAYKGPKEDRRE
jgi:hypothetical protein